MKYFIPLLFTAVFFTAAAQAAPCVNPAGDEGDQVYNITYHVMQYCNGSHWVAMGSVMGQGDDLGDHAATKALDMGDFRIENLAPPNASGDAATKAYVDAEDAKKVSKSGDAMTGHLSLSGAPTANAHATSKEYVDTVVASAAGGNNSGVWQISCSGDPTYLGAFCIRINTETGITQCKYNYRLDSSNAWTNCYNGAPW